MKNIVLTGFMGTGKSEVARELSRLSGLRLIDIDREIESSQQRTISDIFRQDGEEYFRQIETAAIVHFSAIEGAIISTGGGAVLKEENLQALRVNGTIFCLTASPETILERTEGDTDRPLLPSEDRLEKIAELLASRRPFYERSGVMIDTEGKTPLEIAYEIMGNMA